jgi:multidrug efflux pump subunit AcrB
LLKYIIDFFIHRKLLVNLIIIVTLAFGVISLQTIKRESMPEVDMYQIYYTTFYPGASPEDVELKVTIPIEEAIQEVDDIKEVNSVSYENVSSIGITLEDYLNATEAEKVKQDIQKAVDRVSNLPNEIKNRPESFEIQMSKMPIIEVSLSHPDPIELRKIANFFERKLKALPEISKIEKVGYLEKEIHVALDPNKLIATETPVNDILKSLQNRNIRLGGGKLENYDQEKSILTNEELYDISKVKDVIVRAAFGGNNLRIKDVASIKETFEKPSMLVRSNNTSGISLTIVKKKNSDAIRTINKIKSVINKEKKNFSKKLTVNFVNDTSVMTKNRIRIVVTNAILGFILVLICLKIFLDFHTAAWTAFGIPFSLLVSFIAIRALGLSINPVSLGAFIIVIGMLVDDAIVVAENIKRHKEENKPPLQAVRDGVKEVCVPVVTTITTTIVAFSPLIFIPGIMGKFMKILPIVVIVALSASLIESLFFLPAHLLNEKATKKSYKKKQWIVNLEEKYKNLLRLFLKKRYFVVITGILIAIFSVAFAVKVMKFEVIPSSDVDSFFIKMEAPIGTSLNKMSTLAKPIESIIEQIPNQDLDSFGTRIGNDSSFSFSSTGTHTHLAVIYVYLKPEKNRMHTAQEIMNSVKNEIKPYEKQFTKITFEKQRHGPPIGKGVNIRLISDNDQQRNKAGLELFNYIKNINGITDPRNSQGQTKQEYKLSIDHDKLAELGLNVMDVAATIRTAYEGSIPFSIRKDNEDINYRIIMDKKYRGDMNFLLDLPIRNQQKKLVRLKKFAKIVNTESTLEINRHNNQRVFTIYSDLNSDNITAMEANKKIVSYFKNKLANKYKDVDLISGGEAQTSEESLKSLFSSFIIAVIGIYFMLTLLFNSFSQPIFVLSAIPFGLVGIIWTFFLHGQVFSFPALMGFIGLSGVVVNDSLIMVDYINKTSSEDQERNAFTERVLNGARTRLRPIILTTITTVVGLLPTVYGWGGTDFILIPMTMALGYGLAFATIITLFFVPCLTLIHYDFIQLTKKNK